MRKKYGRDNEVKKVPDNAGELVGGDLVIRLQEQVKIQFPTLLEQAIALPHNDKVQWLLNRLEVMEDEQAQTILNTYIAERKRALLVRAQEKRYRRLKQQRKRIEIADAEFPQRSQERIQRIEQEIEEADLQNGALLSVDEIQQILSEDEI